MPLRSIAITSLLLGFDYLAWRGPLQVGGDSGAVVAGLALVPIAITLLWLLAQTTLGALLGAARRLHRGSRLAAARAGAGALPTGRTNAPQATGATAELAPPPSKSPTPGPPAGRIAA